MARLWFCTLFIAYFLFGTAGTANFAQCRSTVESLLTANGTIELDTNGTVLTEDFPDPIYHGAIRGFNTQAKPRPLTLTQSGCETVCGRGPQLNTVADGFQILTTWVLPIVSLLSQLPYESSSGGRIKNLEAFGNWIGAPAAALTTTIWNIWILGSVTNCPEIPRIQEPIH